MTALYLLPDGNPPAAPRVTFPRVLRSERIKLTATRSVWWTIGGTVLGAALFTGLIVLGILVAPTEGEDPVEIVAATFGERPATGALSFVVTLTQFFAAVLGVLVVSSERGTGLLAATATVVPTRTPILVAKLVVSGVASFLVGIVLAVSTYLLMQPALAALDLGAWQLDAATVQVLLGSAVYLALISVIATALGSLFRASAAGIGLVLGAMLLLPAILPMVPVVGGAMAQFLPTAAGMLLVQPFDAVGWPNLLMGLAILLGWTAATSVGAAVLWKKRDI